MNLLVEFKFLQETKKTEKWRYVLVIERNIENLLINYSINEIIDMIIVKYPANFSFYCVESAEMIVGKKSSILRNFEPIIYQRWETKSRLNSKYGKQVYLDTDTVKKRCQE